MLFSAFTLGVTALLAGQVTAARDIVADVTECNAIFASLETAHPGACTQNATDPCWICCDADDEGVDDFFDLVADECHLHASGDAKCPGSPGTIDAYHCDDHHNLRRIRA